MKAKTWQEYSQNKLIEPANLEKKIQELRQQHKTIATLNGSFDLLHAGHMYMLFEAAQTADILIVAVNTDASVRAYKNPKKPIVPLNFRLEMLSAISFVDYLTWFDETDPRVILDRIKPDVHVNGVEYGENCIEAGVVRENGGRLHLVDRLPGLATSAIIAKIQGLSEISCD